MRLDTGYDLLYLTSDLYLRAEQLFRLLYSLTCNDLTYLELQLFKVIKGDLFLWLDVDTRLLFSRLRFFEFSCVRIFSDVSGIKDSRREAPIAMLSVRL